MRTVNGWTEKDIELLIAKTGRSKEAILSFCRAVDKQLYLMLPAHIKRSTLHFHLGKNETPNMVHHDDISSQDETENIIYLQDYLLHAGKGRRR
jgi:hypothetical protein